MSEASFRLELSVAADGWVMEPYFVTQGEVHLERWYGAGTLSDESRIAVSLSGYSNDSLAIDWLQFFQKHTRNRARGQQRLLLFDGHGSHLTYVGLWRPNTRSGVGTPRAC